MGPLAGIRLIELAGIGPGPMAAMMLGDLGADVIRVDRLQPHGPERFPDPRYAVHNRSRRSIAVDLQKPGAAEVVLRLADHADGLMEPFRPGVAERLGVGPDVCLARNQQLVYGRMTGWGQDGPLAKAAGHDINYIALTGVLHAIGRAGDKPVPPLNLVGDFGGGGMLLAFGMVCGLLEAQRSGRGQVVDAAMVDGAALLFGAVIGAHAAGLWQDRRGVNMLDGGAHFYNTYETKDEKYVAIGSIEPQFYALLLEKTGLAAEPLPDQMDRSAWPVMQERLTAIFRSKTRDEWCEIMEGSDVCFAPVLSVSETRHHQQAVARGAYVDVEGVMQPAPAPRFSRTPSEARVAPRRGEHTNAVLREASFDAGEIAALRDAGVVA
ncbi:MAG TPA: CaiB/BaiF CoA-transferase family protein [Acetobacteraceae bacterium]|nr:CaiB/BaiF CoA-transferase family protein [Acetobacteraceae bacterium]